ncbi:MAG: C39 family peptidase [Bacteroidales bacterium]|nr:C39 family peptidase [Bacteroidales bacterium]
MKNIFSLYLLLMTVQIFAQEVIPEVPAYIWRHGCGPTSEGMVLGYYDLHGFPDLIPGDASTQTDAVNAVIASDEHYNDYSLPLDDANTGFFADKSELGGAHANNCIADYMGTSQSIKGNYWGWSLPSDMKPAWENYISEKAPNYVGTSHKYDFVSFPWDSLVSNIDRNRPMVFLVDASGDGIYDHYVCVIGYGIDEGGIKYYDCLNTWDGYDHWYPYKKMAAGVTFGILNCFTFEVHPNWTWTGGADTNWNTKTNWKGSVVPIPGSDVIIPSSPANQPVISGSMTAVCKSLTINSGASLIVAPLGKATITTLTNNGTLNLKSDASGIASLILTDPPLGTGTNNIQLYLTGGKNGSRNVWHYISSPVTYLPASVFTAGDNSTKNLAAYYENLITTNNPNGGWIGSNGFNYQTRVIGTPTFDRLNVGQGYDYYNTSTVTKTFGGILNTADVTGISLAYNSDGRQAYPDANGYNLLGNPFTCYLNWDSVNKPTGLNDAIYFTTNGGQASYVNKVGNPFGTTQYIPPMQGFFVKATSKITGFTLPASAKTHDPTTPPRNRYKGETAEAGKEEEIIPLVRLKIENQTGSDETVVRLEEKATPAFDPHFDAYKFSKSGNYVNIWTTTENVSFSINSLPFPETLVEIPVGLNISESGTYKLSSNEIQGIDDYYVHLLDKTTNSTVNLNKGESISFLTSSGTIENRFILIIGSLLTGIEDRSIPESPFRIYESNGMINIYPLSEEWNGKAGSVKLIDITGKSISYNSNVEFRKNSLILIPAPAIKGFYLVELRTGIKRYVGKVVTR